MILDISSKLKGVNKVWVYDFYVGYEICQEVNPIKNLFKLIVNSKF